MHSPIQIEDFSLSFPHKICFENFSTQISFGDRIGIIGRNGFGKSSLLKMIIEKNSDIGIASVPQIIEDFGSLSGGERFNKALSAALSKNPALLLLDEPTNHLDLHNRRSLMRMLDGYFGTLIIATHDRELLRRCIDILWHIDDGKITIFRGNYDDYVNEMQRKRQSILHEMDLLEREKKSMHQKLMKEQERAAKSKSSGEKKVADRKWMKMVGDLKGMEAEKSQGKKLTIIDEKKQKLSEQLSEIRLPEIIVPKFHLAHQDVGDKILVSITDGTVGYADEMILWDINLSVGSRERVAIVGDNGSGKTTLVRAILGDENVLKSGDWHVPNPRDVGYLDQYYKNLDSEKNAARPPKLLILDEIINNIDLETRNHVVEILREYPGAMIIISHDKDFLEEVGIDKIMQLY
jgi:ATPase subunit of ABC transporter with duplicated ATPase domains